MREEKWMREKSNKWKMKKNWITSYEEKFSI